MIEDTKPVAESRTFIVLNKYAREWKGANTYQSETDLERELVQDLTNQGYEYLPELTTPEAMLSNARVQLQELNNVQFSDDEWRRFEENWLDNAYKNRFRNPSRSHGVPEFGRGRRAVSVQNASVLM